MTPSFTAPLLDLRDIQPFFITGEGPVAVADKISFTVNPGEVVGIVGESGCGKSVTALSIMGLLPRKTAGVASGQILFNNQDLLKKSRSQMKKIVGRRIAMIFQEPMTCLNPVLKIGKQIGEVLETHENMRARERRDRVIELLIQVGIDSPQKRIKAYPHQLSGGMRQRVMIAMALACSPDLLIADEPTTALDVTIQAQILDLIKEISRTKKMAVLMITHDLGVIAEMAQKVLVMYAGRIVEQAQVWDLFNDPLHPYTLGLLNSVPRAKNFGKDLFTIRGTLPAITDLPRGCRFSNRCGQCRPICRVKEPLMRPISSNRGVSCWKGTDEYQPG